MNKLLPILSVIVLSGCAPGIIASGPGSVIVGNATSFNMQEAMDIAQRECRKHGKNAVYIPGPKDGLMEFICQ